MIYFFTQNFNFRRYSNMPMLRRLAPSNLSVDDVVRAAWRNRKNIAAGVKRAYNHAKGNHNAGNAKRQRTMGTQTAKRGAVYVPSNPRNPKISKSRKKLKIKGRKRVKVSRKLRSQILQVSDSNKVHGYFQDNRIEALDPGFNPGKQNVEIAPNRTLTLAGYLFNYDRVLHAASRLWNGKGQVQAPAVGDALNFAPRDTVIQVFKQWWTFRMRNNSTRTVTYRIYKCQKKKNSLILADAYTAWTNGLGDMFNEGQLVTNINQNLLHTGPTLSNQFRGGWTSEVIKVEMEPGQSYSFNVNGPAMTYKGADFYDSATYRAQQPQDIQLIFSGNVDIVGSHTAGGVVGNFGYVNDASTAQPSMERVYIESTYHCSLAMPEKVAGVTQPVFIGSTIFQNTNRVKRICIDDFEPTTFDLMHRRDEQNPQAEVVS